MMVQWREMTKTEVALQKIEYESLVAAVVWAVVIPIAHASRISGKPARLEVGATYTQGMYGGVLT